MTEHQFKLRPASLEDEDEIFALFKAKWGDPKEGDEYGKKIFIFSESPKVTVKEDTITKKWDVEVEAAAPAAAPAE